MLSKLFPVLVVTALIGFVSITAFAYVVEDADRVYYGDADYFENPAVVKAAEIFVQIPEYREIVERGLTKKDPEFWLLLSKANEKFSAAIAKVAESKGYDMIAEVGAVVPEPKDEPLPNVTQLVIDKL